MVVRLLTVKQRDCNASVIVNSLTLVNSGNTTTPVINARVITQKRTFARWCSY